MAGRKAFEPTHEQRQLVEQLVAFGLRQDEICSLIIHCGRAISKPTLAKHFRHELNQGSLKANVKVAANLYRIATSSEKGAVTAAIFWLKTRGGWKEVKGIELTGENGKPIKTQAAKPTKDVVKKIIQELEDEF